MPNGTSISNLKLQELNWKRRNAFHLDPAIIYKWWRRCTVKTLLVTDGGLDFSDGDFGLSAFVHILQNDSPGYARFELTLAHLGAVGGPQVMQGAPGIARSITNFCFDDPAHFAADMYDEVWLFGIDTYFWTGFYPTRNANHATYPVSGLGDEELRRLNAHMARGGGVFATGDHGALGKGLCGRVNRVRGMRYWQGFTLPGSSQDEVGMNNPKRNDTNDPGSDPGTQFSDQSDDIPQRLDLVLYTTWAGFLRNARYPHPLLCGRNGRIDVLPDHPHEGECRVPPDVTLNFELDGSKEYPNATDGSGQVLPEVIAISHVRAGNTADLGGSKQPTIAHTFGAISAYDGHRAAVGRVVCDATWHHFINVNLIGVVEGAGFDQFSDPGRVEDPNKHDGFLSTTTGRVFLDMIKNYYTNIGVWIAPPARHQCFHTRFWWQLVYKDRLMEATLVDPNVEFERIPLDVFYSIGIHARDVLGRMASQCQTLEWTIDWIKKLWPEIVPWLDPWRPFDPRRLGKEPPLPVIDPMPLVEVALGAALVAMRQAFPQPPAEISDSSEKKARSAALDGARRGLELGLRHVTGGLNDFREDLKLLVRGPSAKE